MGNRVFALHPLDVWLATAGLKPYQFAKTNRISLRAIYETVNGTQLNPKLDLLHRIAAGTGNEVTIQMQADWLLSRKREVRQPDLEPDFAAVADAHEDPDDFSEEADDPPPDESAGADETPTEIGPV